MGWETKAVNALSHYFKVTSFRDEKKKPRNFKRASWSGNTRKRCKEPNGTLINLSPMKRFSKFSFCTQEYLTISFNYLLPECRGLIIHFNGKILTRRGETRNGWYSDLPQRKTNEDVRSGTRSSTLKGKILKWPSRTRMLMAGNIIVL